MWKRPLIMLVLVLAFFRAVSPGSAGAAPKKVLTHYHFSGGAFDELNLNAARAFMARNPEVEVKMLFLPDPDELSLVKAVLASGRPIDSVALSNGDAAEFLAAGQLVPIIPASFGKRSIEEVKAMWTPGAIETCGGYWDGGYYGIPFELSSYVGWINTADMREAGLDPARDKPRTWDQFTQVGRRLTRVRDGAVVRNGFMGNSKEGVYNFLVLTAMMEQLGLDWGTERGLAASMGQPKVLARGLKTYTDFVTTSRIWDPALADNDRTGFATNKAAMFLTAGSWFWGLPNDFWKQSRDSVKPGDIEPFPYPRFPDGRDIGGVGYGYCLYVSKLARDPALAFRLLDAMASQPNEFITRGYYQPRVTLSNGRQALDPTLAKKYIPFYDEVFKGELARPAVRLTSTKASQVSEIVWQAITRVIYGGVSVDDSVARLQSDIEGLFPQGR